MSSFQLEWVPTFRPRVAVLLNLTPDHQDRYPNLADYGAAKAALLRRTRTRATSRCSTATTRGCGSSAATPARRCISFGREPVEFGTFIDGDDADRTGAPAAAALRLSAAAAPLRGAHNRENMLAAITAAAGLGRADRRHPRRRCDHTAGLPHRLELVRERGGVRFYDDSKATNVGAVEKSIASFAGGVVLLLGGYDKGGDFSRAARRSCAARVTQLVLFGARRRRRSPRSSARRAAPRSCRTSPPRCARAAARAGAGAGRCCCRPAAPASTSSRDYAERGRRFRALVEAL